MNKDFAIATDSMTHLIPQTERARAFIFKSIPSALKSRAESISIEHQFADCVISAILENGFTIRTH